jgi:hypothetical protein
VLGGDIYILDGHVVTSKGGHESALRYVPVMQTGNFNFFSHGLKWFLIG